MNLRQLIAEQNWERLRFIELACTSNWDGYENVAAITSLRICLGGLSLFLCQPVYAQDAVGKIKSVPTATNPSHAFPYKS